MVYVHFAEGFEEIEALTIVDILRRGEVEIQTVSIAGSRQVTGAHQVTVSADLLFEEADYGACEMLVLPGGLPGAYNLRDHEGLAEEARRFAAQGKYLAAICAAPLALARYGVLTGKKAVIYPGMEDQLADAVYENSPLVTDGRMITSQGPATAMLFALALVQTLKGKQAADQVAAGLLWTRK